MDALGEGHDDGVRQVLGLLFAGGLALLLLLDAPVLRLLSNHTKNPSDADFVLFEGLKMPTFDSQGW
jgi:hypothetical protein